MDVQIWVTGEAGLTDGEGMPVRLVSRRAWGLLTYLVQSGGQPVPRTDLAELLWPDSAPEQARASLRQELAVTRKALRAAGLDLIETTKESVEFTGPRGIADVSAMEDLIAAGSVADLRRAAALCRGPLLDAIAVRSEPYMDWLSEERARVSALAAEAFERLLEAEAESGVAEQALAAEAWLSVDPVAEPAHRALMRVRAATGQPGEALRQYEQCVAALRRVKQASPSDETAVLAAEIRENRMPAPVSPPAAEPPVAAAPEPPETRPDPAPEPETAAAFERGTVTVLIAQLPQFATLDAGFEPMAIARAQARFEEFAARVAEETGGWLLPGPGDRAVAVFSDGAELAAAYAALMLAAEPVPVEQSRPVTPACGLARGAMVLSEGGRLAGVALQAAARAAAMARPGEVLASRAMAPHFSGELETGGGPVRDLLALRADTPVADAPKEAPPPVPELVQLWRAWGQALLRANLRGASEYGEEATAQPGDGRAIGSVMTGATQLLRGRIAEADRSLSAAEDLYSSSEPFGLDPGLTARALLAWKRCLAGKPGESGEALRRVLSEAQGLQHAPSTLMCLLVAALIQDELGETRAALRSAHAAYQAADRSPQLQALALACQGRCRDRIGEEKGAEQLEEALKRFQSAGGVAAAPMIFGWLAASRLETGAPGEGLSLIDEALGEAAATGILLNEPELLRLQAVLLARQGRAGRDQVETAFAGAVEAAGRSGTGLYLLRGSVSFAAWLRGLGRLREASAQLEAGLAAVTQGGPVTADLKSAQALRQRLAMG